MIFADALPRIKTFLRPARLSTTTTALLVRLIAAFVCPHRRLSAAQAASAIRSQARHRAQVVRFLARCHWSGDWSVLAAVAELLLQQETQRGGTWVFLLDQTYVGQQGCQTENTFSRANYRPRRKKGNRKNKKHAKRSCHGFVMGLLLTPSGLRIPCCRAYYTEGHCHSRQLPYRTQIALAADLIRQLAVPPGAEVVVLGDTAFEAADIRVACGERGWSWVVPLNPERVLAGPKPRPKVWSLVTELSADRFAAIRLVPGKGPYAAQRRAARCRLGPKAKARVYYAQAERRQLHNVGDVLLVFSTKEKPKAGEAVSVQKVLLTNDVRRTAAQVVQLYDLRWQIELFFKECKGTLGLHRYRFREFVKVENWVQACLVSFVYLEWYRAWQLCRRDGDEGCKAWWRWQRCYGVSVAIGQATEEDDLRRVYRLSQTPTGQRRLRRCLRAALPREYRPAG
jgi:Transposase DDE domain